MNIDFTITQYTQLLRIFSEYKYQVLKFVDYISNKSVSDSNLILRHDVDKKPLNSLIKAKIEADLGVHTTYYFRCFPQGCDEDIIRKIADLGHEIGYHYEDLALAKGDYDLAIDNFEKNLKKLRKFYPVQTICMHGSPLSKWDNKKLWEKYNYKNYGVIAEPYLDIDFNEIFYLTDTGRSWNNNSVSVRDKVQSGFKNNYNSTQEIIKAIKNGTFPEKVMINTHPQRWTDSPLEWSGEYLTQKIKNIIKQILINKN